MVSKNNRDYWIKEQSKRRPHYGLRKLTVGVASILLSTTFYMQMNAVSAHAATDEAAAQSSAQPQTESAEKPAVKATTAETTTDQSTKAQPAASQTATAKNGGVQPLIRMLRQPRRQRNLPTNRRRLLPLLSRRWFRRQRLLR